MNFYFYRSGLGPVSRNSRELFRGLFLESPEEPEKPFVKLRPAHSVKLIFLYVVKGIKIKISEKFHVTKHLRFEDTKRIMSPEKFRDFRETGPRPELFQVFLSLRRSIAKLRRSSTLELFPSAIQMKFHLFDRKIVIITVKLMSWYFILPRLEKCVSGQAC